jgi:hypothetical protein
MKNLLLVFVLIFGLVAFDAAQDSDKAKRSNAILEKMRQIDLLNQLVPLVMTKDQIRKLLPVIERARQDVRKQQAEEADLLLKYQARIEKAVADGTDKGIVPEKAFLKELNAVVLTMTMKRNAVASDNTDAVLAAMKSTLNVGQLKAAGNSLNPRVFDTGIKPEEMKDDDRLKLFVREIMLDPLSYDVLLKMQAGRAG